MSRRRAASEALRSSTVISTSEGLIETQLTAQFGYLLFELSHYRKVIAVGQRIPSVFDGSKKVEGFLEIEAHLVGRHGGKAHDMTLSAG